jgi:hypothetical protein
MLLEHKYGSGVTRKNKSRYTAEEIESCNLRVKNAVYSLVPSSVKISPGHFVVFFWKFKENGKQVNRNRIRNVLGWILSGKATPAYNSWIRHLEKCAKAVNRV